MKKWNAYEVDYEYGTAIMMLDHTIVEEDVIDLFYTLAGQCFGIRKSLGEVKILGHSEPDLDKVVLPEDKSSERHPELYDNPLSRMLKTMSSDSFTIPREMEEKASYILVHSGGDLIAWSEVDEKIKSEWD